MLSDHFFRMYTYIYICVYIYNIIHTYIHPQTLPDFNEAHELRPRGRCLCRVGQVCPAARGNRSGGQRWSAAIRMPLMRFDVENITVWMGIWNSREVLILVSLCRYARMRPTQIYWKRKALQRQGSGPQGKWDCTQNFTQIMTIEYYRCVFGCKPVSFLIQGPLV